MKQSLQLSGNIDRAIQTLYDFRQQNQRFHISNAEGNHLVTVAEIVFCKTIRVNSKDGNTCIRFQFQLTDGRKIIASGTSLSRYKKILAPFLFARISRSCLINLLHIKIFIKNRGKIVMKAWSDNNMQIIEEEFDIPKNNREQVNAFYEALIPPL